MHVKSAIKVKTNQHFYEQLVVHFFQSQDGSVGTKIKWISLLQSFHIMFNLQLSVCWLVHTCMCYRYACVCACPFSIQLHRTFTS